MSRQTGARFCVQTFFVAMLVGAPHAYAKISSDLTQTRATALNLRPASNLRLMQSAAQLEYAVSGKQAESAQHTTFTPAEYEAYSGIGAIVCSAAGERRAATAFLVGGFDIAVTVAHAFERNGIWSAPSECLYTSIGADGVIRERIPLASIKAQWQIEPDTLGSPTSDVAVVRLSTPVRLAQRTMSFTKFAGTHAPVVLVGFQPDLVTDTRKHKARGHVYPRRANACAQFAHDVDSRDVTSGAPLIDSRDGVVVGIHTRLASRRSGERSSCSARGNAMIKMSDWLETTLRAEIASSPAERAVERSANSDTRQTP